MISRVPSPRLLLVVTVALLSGCADTSGFLPLNRAALRASGPKTLLVRGWRPAPFDGAAVKFMLPLSMYLLSAAMTGTMDSLGEEGIADPAIRMRLELSQALVKRFSVKVVAQRSQVKVVPPRPQVDDSDPAGHPITDRADLLLDIRTTDWGIVPTRLRHYAAKYEGTLVLTDLRTGEILARAECGGRPLDNSANPTFERLKAGGASLAKEMIAEAGDVCFQVFRKEVLGLF